MLESAFIFVFTGPKTIEELKGALSDCKTVIWNGPMGVFEMPAFAKGTNAIATTLAELTSKVLQHTHPLHITPYRITHIHAHAHRPTLIFNASPYLTITIALHHLYSSILCR